MTNFITFLAFCIPLYFVGPAVAQFRTSFHPSKLPGFIEIQETDISKLRRYNLSQCNNVQTQLDVGSISRFKANGNCFNIYENRDCKGQFVRFQPGRLFNDIDNIKAHRWEDGVPVKDEHVKFVSIGPCLNQCDARNWEGMEKGTTVEVTMYPDEDFGGIAANLTISGMASCFLMPAKTVRVKSIKIAGNQNSSCIELHEEPSCGGNSVQLRPGYPHLHDLYYWGITSADISVYAKAISLCGTFCNVDVPRINPVVGKSPGVDMVTLYDGLGYYGNPTHVHLGGGACLNLTHNPPIRSIQTYGACIVLLEGHDCQEKWRWDTFQIGKHTTNDYYRTKVLAGNGGVRWGTGSIRLCNKQEEMVQPGQKVNADDCEKDTVPFLVWLIMCMVLAIVICFAAVAGAFIARYYENVKLRSNTERFNILYRPQS